VQINFATPDPTRIGLVREQAAQIGAADAIVQGRGELTGQDSYSNFQIRLKELGPQEQARFTTLLEDRLDAERLGIKNVSSSFSRQILQNAIIAIVISFALIALYVTWRYRWRFAIPILRTLFNDVLITLGVYAISGREVTAATVAAILTILGYSVYDTIIVFDRIRENMRLMPRASIARIANISVWEVMRRSIFTTVSTLLPITALFIFGGDTLKDFAFAIIVGISIGAVSTLFVATPLLTWMMERDPEYSRRRVSEDEGEDVLGPKRGLLAPPEAPAAATAPVPAETVEEPVEAVVDGGGDRDGSRDAKRERRRPRRRTRPHGRAR